MVLILNLKMTLENKTESEEKKCVYKENARSEDCELCNGFGEYRKFNLIFYCDSYDSGKFDKDGRLK